MSRIFVFKAQPFVLLLLVLSLPLAWFFLDPLEMRAWTGRPADLPGHRPPPSLWEVAREDTLREAGAPGDWSRLEHPSGEYCLSVPSGWAVGSPRGFRHARALLLEKADGPGIRFLLIPWIVQDRPLEEEVGKSEAAWFLSGAQVTSWRLVEEKEREVGGRSALVRRYSAILPQGGRGVPWRVLVTYVVARPRCYALVLVCPEGAAEAWLPYEGMVSSFRALYPDGRPVKPPPPEGG